MRSQVLALCVGIAVHSRMRDIPAWLQAPGLLPELLPELPARSAGWALLCLLLLLALWFSQRLRDSAAAARGRLLHGCSLLLFAGCGLVWAMLIASIQLDRRLPLALEGVDFWVSGQVEGLVSHHSGQVTLRVQASCFRLLPEHCDFRRSQFRRFQFRRFQGDNNVLVGQRVVLNNYGALRPRAGEHWLLRVRLNRPHGMANPGAYDFEAGQLQRRIMARGYIRDTAFNRRLDAAPALNLSRLRTALAQGMENAAPGLPNAGILSALVIGDYAGISSAQWDLFSATGTNHLVVISGMHVAFIALMVGAVVNRLSRLCPALLLRMPAQHLAGWAAMLAAVAYALLAGFSLPVQRALIMIVVLMGSRLLGRTLAPADSLSLAALLVLLHDPMAVTQAGFWLSFIAVASLFMVFAGVLHFDVKIRWARQLWRRWAQPQWAVTAGLLLPLLLWTGQISLNSPLANLFAIPLVSILVVPLALLAALLVALGMPGVAGVLQLADYLLTLMQSVLIWLTTVSPPLWQPAPPSLAATVLMICASALLLMPRGLAPRWLALLMLLPVIWPTPATRPLPGRVWLQFLDVGQGLAVVVHTQRHTLLFDTGPALGPEFDAGRAAILPYLRHADVRRLDTLIISHWHADHSGGLATVLQEMPVGQRLTGVVETAPSGNTADFQACQAGQRWSWDDVQFSVLYPPADVRSLIGRSSNINNTSCVLLIEAGGQRALLTGDIEQVAERWLLREHGAALAVDILQAPHHGSRSSSTAQFVQATRAHWVLMSAGHRNRFDHPHAEVSARYLAQGAQLLHTADSGAVLMEMGGDDVQLLQRYRQQARRYWFNL